MILYRIRAVFEDPVRSSLVVLAGLGLAGLVVLGLTWRGVAAQTWLADQVAFVTSGGFGGVAMMGVAVALLMMQTRRLAEARHRARMQLVIGVAASLLDRVSPEDGQRS